MENVGVEKQTGVSDIADIVLYNLQGRTECLSFHYFFIFVPACFVQTLVDLPKQSTVYDSSFWQTAYLFI